VLKYRNETVIRTDHISQLDVTSALKRKIGKRPRFVLC
jgi:hypothetical protein